MTARIENDQKGFIVMLMKDGKAMSCLHFNTYGGALNYAIACEFSEEVDEIKDLAVL